MLRRAFLTGLFAAFLTASTVFAGEITFFGTTDKNPLEYEPGEKMTFSVQCLEDGAAVSGKKLTWKRTGDDGKTESGEAVSDAANPLKIETSIDVPGFVRIQVYALDENGKPLGGEQRQFNGGAGVLLDQIEGTPEPADFDAFWNRQKEILAQVPMKYTLTRVDADNEKFDVYDVKVDCAGPTPVSGYLCVPKNAEPKSLPAVVCYQGYSVVSAGKPFVPNAISFQINVHGILNGQSREYYQELNSTYLNSYGFSKEENSNPNVSFWRGALLRVMRSLEFVKSLPEWNGVDLKVRGGSQGGLQSLAAAGLDADVTEVEAHVPWFCDLAGKAKNARLGGWFPEWVDGLGYFDSTNHAKRIKAKKVTIYSGLGDYVCPPSGQVVLFKAIPTETLWVVHQGKTHGFTQKDAPEYVLEKPAK